MWMQGKQTNIIGSILHTDSVTSLKQSNNANEIFDLFLQVVMTSGFGFRWRFFRPFLYV